MTQQIFETDIQAAEYTAAAIEALLRQKPDSVLCLAAGHTSIPVFERLLEAAAQKHIDFHQVRFIGLDEWLGIGADTDGSCASFLHRNFFDKLDITPDQFCLFDGKASDPEAECVRIETQIEVWGGIDYMLLGMGMNGHLALNEPGDSFSNGAHVTDLDATTKSVAPKYFSADMPPLEHGITLGIKNILDARLIHLTIFGAHKKDAVSRLLNTEIDNHFPASVLKSCDHAVLVLDRAAYGQDSSTETN